MLARVLAKSIRSIRNSAGLRNAVSVEPSRPGTEIYSLRYFEKITRSEIDTERLFTKLQFDSTPLLCRIDNNTVTHTTSELIDFLNRDKIVPASVDTVEIPNDSLIGDVMMLNHYRISVDIIYMSMFIIQCIVAGKVIGFLTVKLLM